MVVSLLSIFVKYWIMHTKIGTVGEPDKAWGKDAPIQES